MVLRHDGTVMEPDQLVPPPDSAVLSAFAFSALKERNAEYAKAQRVAESVTA